MSGLIMCDKYKCPDRDDWVCCNSCAELEQCGGVRALIKLGTNCGYITKKAASTANADDFQKGAYHD